MNSASHLPKQEQLPTLLLLDAVKPNASHTSFLVSINFPLVTIAEDVPASGTSSTTISVMDFFAFLDAHLVEYSSEGPALPSDFLGRTFSFWKLLDHGYLLPCTTLKLYARQQMPSRYKCSPTVESGVALYLTVIFKSNHLHQLKLIK